MKTNIIIGLMILGILIVSGCIQKETKYVCPDGSIVSSASLCKQESEPSYQLCNYNEDCPTNEVCQRQADGEGRCVNIGTGDICGDEKCSTMELKQGSCPKDCSWIYIN